MSRAERQQAALARWLRLRDDASLAEACAAWDNVAWYYAKRHSRHAGAEVEDCVQAARMGLIDGLHRWNPAKGAFSTIAVDCIRGRLTRLERTQRMISVPHPMLALRKRLDGAADGDDRELARRFGVGAGSIRAARTLDQFGRIESLSVLGIDDEGHERECWDVGADDPALSAVEAAMTLGPLLQALTPIQREVIRLRYWDGLTLAETGERLGRVRESVRLAELAAIKRMRRLATGGLQ